MAYNKRTVHQMKGSGPIFSCTVYDSAKVGGQAAGSLDLESVVSHDRMICALIARKNVCLVSFNTYPSEHS